MKANVVALFRYQQLSNIQSSWTHIFNRAPPTTTTGITMGVISVSTTSSSSRRWFSFGGIGSDATPKSIKIETATIIPPPPPPVNTEEVVTSTSTIVQPFPGLTKVPVYHIIPPPPPPPLIEEVPVVLEEVTPPVEETSQDIDEASPPTKKGKKSKAPKKPKRPKKEKKPKRIPVKKPITVQSLDSTFDDAYVSALSSASTSSSSPASSTLHRWSLEGQQHAIRYHSCSGVRGGAGKSILASHQDCEDVVNCLKAAHEVRVSKSGSDTGVVVVDESVGGNNMFHIVIGCDEAGRGPLAGPLTCASFARLYLSHTPPLTSTSEDETGHTTSSTNPPPTPATRSLPPPARDSKAVGCGTYRRAMFSRLAGDELRVEGPSDLDRLPPPRQWLIANSGDRDTPLYSTSPPPPPAHMIHLNNTIVASHDHLALETSMRRVLECPDVAGVGVACKVHIHYGSSSTVPSLVEGGGAGVGCRGMSLSSSYPVVEEAVVDTELVDRQEVSDQTPTIDQSQPVSTTRTTTLPSSSPVDIVQFSSVIVVNNGAIDRLGISTSMMSATVDAALTTRHSILQWLASNPQLLPKNTPHPTFSVIMDGANIPLELYTTTTTVADTTSSTDAFRATPADNDGIASTTTTPAAPPAFHCIVPVIKGDSKSYSVAAASILAKVSRDDMMGGRLSWKASPPSPSPPPPAAPATNADERSSEEGGDGMDSSLSKNDDTSSSLTPPSTDNTDVVSGTTSTSVVEEEEGYITPYSSLFPHYGLELNSGYGTSLHTAAIREYGHSPVHRRTFRLRTAQQDEEE